MVPNSSGAKIAVKRRDCLTFWIRLTFWTQPLPGPSSCTCPSDRVRAEALYSGPFRQSPPSRVCSCLGWYSMIQPLGQYSNLSFHVCVLIPGLVLLDGRSVFAPETLGRVRFSAFPVFGPRATSNATPKSFRHGLLELEPGFYNKPSWFAGCGFLPISACPWIKDPLPGASPSFAAGKMDV